MDALELQAALVKLDPATTVTPIGSSVKLIPIDRMSFYVNDEGYLTCRNPTESQDEKLTEKLQSVATTTGPSNGGGGSVGLGAGVGAGVGLPASNRNHENPQAGASKCVLGEVR
ncbi:uncharacterized protein LOC107264424 [Cephus cinctus]|uniref:Uncharacterized protein LOC107264424 n=1 Tax=Cephus cinctus TaxID=211228 RepID=A0AAJ7FER1_CEPCN|nr:uncharacterized protein LOC107264424 [Cephus cinctus]XP_024937465.1 uncharacterized protein LOC107264424 [Cephus cinctus]XP_024937466.1 uncharacterized protein LOC107264424 [Cephus cinctus]